MKARPPLHSRRRNLWRPVLPHFRIREPDAEGHDLHRLLGVVWVADYGPARGGGRQAYRAAARVSLRHRLEFLRAVLERFRLPRCGASRSAGPVQGQP